jgi:hypothetical protein
MARAGSGSGVQSGEGLYKEGRAHTRGLGKEGLGDVSRVPVGQESGI